MALRDPAGYVEAVIMLPVDLVEIVALFDGEHSIAAIQAELQRDTASTSRGRTSSS